MSIYAMHTPKIFAGQDVNQVVCSAIRCINQTGETRNSRNGPVKSIYRAEMVVADPRARYLNIPGRKSNIFQMMAETLWVMAGLDNVHPFLSYFLPRAANYSDDGVTWRGAYGPRLFAFDQLEDVVKAFEQDGLDTRRAVLAIYQPHLDSRVGLSSQYGLEGTKDLPCNNFINFWVDADKRFHMEVIQRSGDIIWGAGSINLYEFSFLQECVFELVKKRTGEQDLQLGTYCHRVTNLHFYPEVVGQQIEDIINQNQVFCWAPAYQPETMAIDLGSIKDTHEMREFFGKVVERLTLLIHSVGQKLVGELPELTYPTMDELEELFETYGVPAKQNNTLWVVTEAVVSQLTHKRAGWLSEDSCESLMKCVEACKFRKFDLAHPEE